MSFKSCKSSLSILGRGAGSGFDSASWTCGSVVCSDLLSWVVLADTGLVVVSVESSRLSSVAKMLPMPLRRTWRWINNLIARLASRRWLLIHSMAMGSSVGIVTRTCLILSNLNWLLSYYLISSNCLYNNLIITWVQDNNQKLRKLCNKSLRSMLININFWLLSNELVTNNRIVNSGDA